MNNLKKYLRDCADKERATNSKIVEFKDSFFPRLSNIVQNDDDPDTRAAAILALTESPTEAKESAQFLLDAVFSDQDARIRRIAAAAFFEVFPRLGFSERTRILRSHPYWEWKMPKLVYPQELLTSDPTGITWRCPCGERNDPSVNECRSCGKQRPIAFHP